MVGFLRLGGPGLFLDATVGDGGHAEALLDAEPGARLLACDRDPAAIARAGARLARFGGRVTLAQAAFRDAPAAHARAGAEPFAGALLDLGVSSPQIDDPERGMSFRADAPLDLRMDPGSGDSAAERLARANEDDVAAVLRAHADLGPSRRLARALVEAAREGRLATTGDLARVVERQLGSHPRQRARVFQALRTWVNDEAAELDAMLAWLPDAVRPGGVVVTLAYHSGEDRRIKRALRGEPAASPKRLPPSAPAPAPGPWDELTRKVVAPSPEEVAANPRARSARLRAFRRRST